MTNHIYTLIDDKRDQERNLDRLIGDEEEESENARKWEDERREVEGARRRLEDDKRKLDVPINLEQATKDNQGLERAIKEQRDSTTKDWKVEYDKKVVGTLCSVDLRSSTPLKRLEGGIR